MIKEIKLNEAVKDVDLMILEVSKDLERLTSGMTNLYRYLYILYKRLEKLEEVDEHLEEFRKKKYELESNTGSKTPVDKHNM